MYNEKKEKFIKMPVYEGGQTALKQFINENLTYPSEALNKKIEGTIQVFFIIGTNGKVVEAKTLNNLGYGCDEEAIRVIKLLEFKIPKTHNIRATFNKKINIHFRLNKNKPVENIKEINTLDAQIQIHYDVITASHKNEPAKKGVSYTIQIKLNS